MRKKWGVTRVFEADSAKVVMNERNVIKALKDVGAKLDFVYLKTKERRSREVELKEFSGDIYNVFTKIAKETGSIVMIATRDDTAMKEIITGKK